MARTAFTLTLTATPDGVPPPGGFGSMRATVTRLDKHSPTVKVHNRTREDYPTTEAWILGNTMVDVVTPQWGGWGAMYAFHLGLPPRVPGVGTESDVLYLPG
jgi:hypothetical protein